MGSLESAFRKAAVEHQQEGGFSLNLELSDQIRTISLHDSGLHPHVMEQAKGGTIQTTVEKHRSILTGPKKRRWAIRLLTSADNAEAISH